MKKINTKSGGIVCIIIISMFISNKTLANNNLEENKIIPAVAKTTTAAPTDITITPSAIEENRVIGATVGTLSAVPSAKYLYTLVTGTGSTDNSSFDVKNTTAKDQDSGAGDNSGILIYNDGNPIWQSFTAGTSSFLTKIVLKSGGSSSSETMKLKLFRGEGIAGTLLGESTAAMTHSGDGLVEWNFNNIALTSGQKYTFQLTEYIDASIALICWGSSYNGNQYTGGKLNYTSYPNYELVFKTYMISSSELIAKQSFDYETKTTYNIRLRATNVLNEYFEKEHTISITDVNDATEVENKSVEEISIYPNPATKAIKVNGIEKGETVYIYTLNGVQVLTQELNDNKLIDISLLKPGMYMVKSKGLFCKLIKK